MNVLISHNTALDYWRYHFSPDMEIGEPIMCTPAKDSRIRKTTSLAVFPSYTIIPKSPSTCLFSTKANVDHPAEWFAICGHPACQKARFMVGAISASRPQSFCSCKWQPRIQCPSSSLWDANSAERTSYCRKRCSAPMSSTHAPSELSP